jgi:REP element-mobilizing transposase RayT
MAWGSSCVALRTHLTRSGTIGQAEIRTALECTSVAALALKSMGQDMLDSGRGWKINRHFRATRKLKTPNVVSHITQRAAGKEPLFVEEKDYVYMLWLLKEVTRKYSLTLYAFCLMSNHVHLLLSPGEENLYDAMQNLFSRYAMIFNRKYERKGHLFGGPYRQAVCLARPPRLCEV